MFDYRPSLKCNAQCLKNKCIDSTDNFNNRDCFFNFSRIAELCQNLHMSYTGAGDYLSDEEFELSIMFLEHKLKNWTEYPNQKWSVYDEAMRMLIIATLAETKERRAENLHD